MRHYLLPILIIALLNTVTVQLAKRKFGEALPVTLISIPLLLFLSQFAFKTFDVAFFGLLAASAVGLITLIVRRKDLSNYFSYGFVAYIVVCLIVLVIDWRRAFSDFDEFWHWGPMVKEMLRLDQFYCVDASRMVIHKDYPPFLALIELFWARIAGSSQEGVVSAALHSFYICLIVAPLSEKMQFSGRKTLKSIGWAASICVLVLVIVGIFDHAHIAM